ncbi:hypothetical protein CDD83_3626 [Cordyceps sp. RAO-2017]|nr:hypothetical protein CDD83_3626 [Cordyceps sp. RAO-2017]
MLATAAGVARASGPAIQWGACTEKFESQLPVDCGRLTVPLDYTEPASSPKLDIELLRVPATVQPAKGSIFLNFGGPGLPARHSMASLSGVLQAMSGGQFNLVTFDPRGTGNTIPFTCYDPIYWRQTFWQEPISPGDADDILLGKLWARGTTMADFCAKTQNDTGRLINTAFVARDIVQLADALGEDGLVRYWGFSYGTTLGATLVAMFPHKVDKVVLDGVQNPHEYYHAYAYGSLSLHSAWKHRNMKADIKADPTLKSDFEEWSQSDEVFSGIFKACAANPHVCALARPGKSAAELEKSAWQLLDRLKRRPMAIGTAVVDDNLVRVLIAQSLYTTTSWKMLTDALDMLITGRIDEDYLRLAFGSSNSIRTVDDLDTAINQTVAVPFASVGIHCVDRAARAKTFEKTLPALRRLFQTSRAMGGAGSGPTVVCAQWKIEPKERYAGDFRARTRKPILLVGNSYDAHTPIRSARNVSSGFEGSVVLEVNGYGVRIYQLCMGAAALGHTV